MPLVGIATQEYPNRVAARPFQLLSLCSGVGGLELGLRSVLPSARTVCYVEREAYCVQVLAERMAEGRLDAAPVWSDVRTFEGGPWRGVVDCVTGGFPCQPYSSASRGRVTARPVWKHVARIVRETETPLVFLENVHEKAFDGLIDTLHTHEFTLLSLRAADVGAPHLRRRVFALGHTDDGLELCRTIHAQTPELPRVRTSPWETLPPQLRMDDGLADRVDRLRACGNGIVPLMASWAWKILLHHAIQ